MVAHSRYGDPRHQYGPVSRERAVADPLSVAPRGHRMDLPASAKPVDTELTAEVRGGTLAGGYRVRLPITGGAAATPASESAEGI